MRRSRSGRPSASVSRPVGAIDTRGTRAAAETRRWSIRGMTRSDIPRLWASEADRPAYGPGYPGFHEGMPFQAHSVSGRFGPADARVLRRVVPQPVGRKIAGLLVG